MFSRLDGFSLVDISIADSKAGPFALSSFELHRAGDGPYRLTADGKTSVSSLLDYGAENVAILPGGASGSLAGLADVLDTFLMGDSIPIHVDMQLSSADGRVEVITGGGSTIGGISIGSLAELITDAIVVQL